MKELKPLDDSEVDAFMAKVYEPFRYRWCDSTMCFCMGCVNRSASSRQDRSITREQWDAWVKRNPKRD